MNNTIVNKFRLRDLRRNAGMTAEQMGKVIGVSHGTISKWESGFIQPSREKLAIIARYFNVSIDYLIGETDIPDRYSPSKSNQEFIEILQDQRRRELINSIQETIATMDISNLEAFERIISSFKKK